MIRKARYSDLDLLSILFDGYRCFYGKNSDVESARNFLLQRIEENDSEIFVHEPIHGKLSGFVQLYPIFSSTRMQKMWLLNDLYVDPSFRNQGVSKLLIEQSKELCKETKAAGLMLETSKSNEIGNYLYPQVGFSLMDSVNFYFWENS
jgi:GNAT superfamily N-acetyltransferase